MVSELVRSRSPYYYIVFTFTVCVTGSARNRLKVVHIMFSTRLSMLSLFAFRIEHRWRQYGAHIVVEVSSFVVGLARCRGQASVSRVNLASRQLFTTRWRNSEYRGRSSQTLLESDIGHLYSGCTCVTSILRAVPVVRVLHTGHLLYDPKTD